MTENQEDEERLKKRWRVEYILLFHKVLPKLKKSHINSL